MIRRNVAGICPIDRNDLRTTDLRNVRFVNKFNESQMFTPSGQIIVSLLSGPKTVREIQKIVKYSQPTVSKCLGSLSAQNMVYKKPDECDLRRHVYVLTDNAVRFLIDAHFMDCLMSIVQKREKSGNRDA